MSSLLKRIEKLETSAHPAAPTGEEMMAASERQGVRAAMAMRELMKAWITDACATTGIDPALVHFDEELGTMFGMPGLWRSSELVREQELLPVDTEEQRSADEDVLRSWRKAHRIAADTDPRAEREIDRLLNRIGHGFELLDTRLYGNS